MIHLLLLCLTLCFGEQVRGPGVVLNGQGNEIGAYSGGGEIIGVDFGQGSDSAVWQNPPGAYYGQGVIYVCWCSAYAGDHCYRWSVTMWVYTGGGWQAWPVQFEANSP